MLRGIFGSGGGAPVGGSGTTNTIPRWTGATTLGDSGLIDNGTAIYTTTRNVGVGTASPSTRLHVSDNSSIPVIIQSSGSTDSFLRFINTSNNLGYIGYIGTNLYLAPNNGAGYVGVGTSSPASRLDVAGTITCDDAGTGLKLPATPGNADTQTLDCYAEGTWTPTLAGFATNTPNSVVARYTRIGRMVMLNVYLYAGGSSFGSTLGTTTISVPAGMSPNFEGVGIGGLSRTTSTVAQAIAYYDGKIYLGTSASAAAEMWVSVIYIV